MSERAWKYGTVIRVDPTTQPQVKQPDDRRWMVVSFDDRLKWTLLFITPNFTGAHLYSKIMHWPAMYGFCRVEEPE